MNRLSLRFMLAILGGISPSTMFAHENENTVPIEITPECPATHPSEPASALSPEPSALDEEKTEVEKIILDAKIKAEKCLMRRIECDGSPP